MSTNINCATTGPSESVHLTHIDPEIFPTFETWHEVTKPKPNQPDGQEELVTTRKKIIDFQQVVQYLNNYLIWIDDADPTQLIEITDEYPRGFLIRKVSTCAGKTGQYAAFKTHFEGWVKSPQRRHVKKISYIPYLIQRPDDAEGEFNLFHGFKHIFEPNFVVDLNLIQPWLGLLEHIWCSDDQNAYQYLLNWFAHKIQSPEKKIGVALILKSVLQGAGKNTFFTFFINHVLGHQYGTQIGDAERLFERFNAEFEFSLLVCCDEIGNQGAMYKNADKLKAIVTRDVFKVEHKGLDVRSDCPDYNDYIMFSNNDYIVKTEASDRRNLCLELSNARVGDHLYWSMIYSSMTDIIGQHFFHYLAQRNLDNFNPRDIPMTEWKRELKERGMDPMTKMLIHFIKNHCSDAGVCLSNETRFHTVEFEDAFDQIAQSYNCEKRPKFNAKSMGMYFHKVLNLQPLPSPFKKNETMRRGYQISIPDLMMKVRKILNDPEFSFGKSEYDCE